MRIATEIVRIIIVMALVAYAAALLTPKDRLPLALRGLARLLGKETSVRDDSRRSGGVTWGKRLFGIILIVFAFILALIRL